MKLVCVLEGTFEIAVGKDKVMLQASSTAQKLEWLKRIGNAITACKVAITLLNPFPTLVIHAIHRLTLTCTTRSLTLTDARAHCAHTCSHSSSEHQHQQSTGNWIQENVIHHWLRKMVAVASNTPRSVDGPSICWWCSAWCLCVGQLCETLLWWCWW